jgi:hypothetical protein
MSRVALGTSENGGKHTIWKGQKAEVFDFQLPLIIDW